VRLFLAINLDPATRRELHEATQPLRSMLPDLSWTPEAKLHLTLRFLGDQPDQVAASLGHSLDGIARRHRPFAMELRHVGAFPHFRGARVLWMGVEPSPRLELLHHEVELACDALGLGIDARPFRPHVTLARIRDRRDDAVMRPFAKAARAIGYAGTVGVERIDVMRSTLGPGGSTYECLHGSPLRGD
jgi:RNA 2',3'-cyclic 3'-phosphodiesterase